MSRFAIDWASKDDRLLRFHAEGLGRKAIAERLGVSNGAIRRRMIQLGLTQGSLR